MLPEQTIRTVTILASLGAALLFGAAVEAGPVMQGSRWAEGEPAPPVRLPTIDGHATLDLYSLRGERVLLIELASW